jgi:hypothetical protein
MCRATVSQIDYKVTDLLSLRCVVEKKAMLFHRAKGVFIGEPQFFLQLRSSWSDGVTKDLHDIVNPTFDCGPQIVVWQAGRRPIVPWAAPVVGRQTCDYAQNQPATDGVQELGGSERGIGHGREATAAPGGEDSGNVRNHPVQSATIVDLGKLGEVHTLGHDEALESDGIRSQRDLQILQSDLS